MNRSSPPLFHGVVLVTSATIGAGVFSLPIVSAGMWFGWTAACLFAIWLLSYLGALLLLEATLVYPRGASFYTIVNGILGEKWNLATSIGMAFLMYILIYAYISAGGNIINHTFASITGGESPISQNVSSVLFAAFFATLIWFGTTLVSRLCTVLMIGMAVSYLLFNAGLVLHVEIFKLFNTQVQVESYSQYIWAALPYFLTSFGFAGLVPSLVKYYGPEPKTVHRCMLYGTLITLGLYLIWILVAFGTLSRGSWVPVIAAGGNIADLIVGFQGVTEAHSQNMSLLLNLFSNFAVTSSISAVGLVMFDYITDAFGFDDGATGRLKSLLIAFGPPALVCLFFPHGFIVAIGYAGLVMIFGYFLVPVRLVLKLRSDQLETPFRVWGGSPLVYGVLAFSLLIGVFEVMSMFDALPVYP
ncbi:MAG: tryptophan permease [Gammaproteobacteria bacterium]|jgi:tryptophan-specific transport protein|nr:tryptophan permease [Gammaproteobacteria bacterium]MBT3870264.1 tryptophan permease [Gammaproteobacteria bacterium]MBT4381343.1 tryptophan permease [Gammaproteobacteria bacterium]MBT4615651.1 tryptophan permease [Gammaproteobacteria bacterium]MBT5196716.1 tryptophan permease [Gammaproteobacteria bacterium]